MEAIAAGAAPNATSVSSTKEWRGYAVESQKECRAGPIFPFISSTCLRALLTLPLNPAPEKAKVKGTCTSLPRLL